MIIELNTMTFCAIQGNERSNYLLWLDKGKTACYIKSQSNIVKAENETSRPPAGLREPGKV